MKKAYDSVDLLKFIASILVFTMHLRLFTDTPVFSIIQVSARWCIPFFFIVSSFFLFKGSENGSVPSKKLGKYVKRILILYLVWTVINLPSIAFNYYIRKNTLSIDVLFTYSISGTFFGSWYLLSTVFSAWLINLLSKKLRSKWILLLTFPIYLICVFSSVYGNLLPVSVSSILRNVLCFPLNFLGGCFYFAIGKYLADHHQKLQRLHKVGVCLLAMLSCAAYCAELMIADSFGLLYSTDVSFSVALFGLSFVLLGFAFSRKIKHHLSFRKMSTVIYCAQGNVMALRTVLISKVFHGDHDILLMLLMLLVMAGIVLLVFLLQKKSRCKVFQYLT